MRSWHIIYLTQLLGVTVKCNNREGTKSKNLLPYFRRQVEEDLHYHNTKGLSSNDPQGHLVSFLVNNLEEIFSANDEITEFSVSPSPSHATEILSTKNYISTFEEDRKLADDIKGYRNVSLTTRIDHQYASVSPGYAIKKAKHSHMLLVSENSLKKSKQKLIHNQTYLLVSSLAPEPSDTPEPTSDHGGDGRSCIFCNNVMTEECSDPKNKLIPSVVCERDGDQCYSLHTPFGVIDRGCLDVNRNLTIYVCACNLCNYKSLTEMPHVFSNKREWVHNVVELSRTRSLRKSVYKDMACLKCEANMTESNKKGIIYNENCLQGNIGSVPTEICDTNEICAVKVIKGEGYVWRGCVRTPLYNYWWSVCDRDLCNYDSLVSVYDYL